MIVAVGSERTPKIEAVEAVFRELSTRNTAFKISYLISRSVNSETMETPLSTDHLISGAFNRVLNLQKELSREEVAADIYIGMEGGLHQVKHHSGTSTFLQSWVYASNGNNGYFGSSGNLPVPDSVTSSVYKDGESLGSVIDTFTGKAGVRDNEGSFGVFTQNYITRSQSFQTALFAALAPFYNYKYYH